MLAGCEPAAVEVIPRPNMTEDSELQAWIAGHIKPYTGHPAGGHRIPCSKEAGRVVGPALNIYGTTKSIVVDN